MSNGVGVLEQLDQVLVESPLAEIQALVERLERQHPIEMVRAPRICLTMLRAEDSLDQQEFLLGEALTTSCEVSVRGVAGHGMCLGDEPVRSYCIAVLDALREQGGIDAETLASLSFLSEKLNLQRRMEFAQTLRTQVDFKLLEQE